MTEHIHIRQFGISPGRMIMGAFRAKLCLLDWAGRKGRKTIDARLERRLGARMRAADDPLFEAVRQQLEEYLAGRRQTFDLPLLLAGTPFQEKVWRALMKIPYGRTVTYTRLARAIGNDQARRAVAAANGANALSIVIPCHRVIAADGSPGGYAGGSAAKRRLLELEGALETTAEFS